jgi:saccharopine dehydrogenase-like NADP-dependent oxidoreductase
MDKNRKKVIVLGGYGAIGSRVCTAIARIPYVECVIAGRNPKRARRLAKKVAASTLRIDADNSTEIQRHLPGAFLVINTAGPFTGRSVDTARFCAENGIHYIDVADDHHYVNEVLRLNGEAKRNGCLLVAGAASLPAMASVLVDSLDAHYEKLDEIHVSALAGSKVPAGLASARSLLEKIGEMDRVKLRGRWREVLCWSGPVKVLFPVPLQRRRVYLYSIPAADQFSRRYGVREATFRFGLTSGFLNRGLAVIAWLRRVGLLKEPARFARPLLSMARWFDRSGGSTFVIQAQVLGSQSDQSVEHAAALMDAESDGFSLQAAMVINLARDWIEQGVPEAGAISAIGQIDLEALKPDLIAHNVKLIRA